MSQTDYWHIPSKMAITVLGVLLGGAISFNAWAVAAIYERPSKSAVREMIEDVSPFTRDRAMILDVLNQIRETNVELRKAVDRNSQMISEMRAQFRNG